MARAHEAKVSDVTVPLCMAIVSSDGREAMVNHARDLKARNVPTFIDPSHALPILDRDELRGMIDGCAAYVVNDYEWTVTLEKTGWSEDEVSAHCDAVIITKGAEGSEIRTSGDVIEIPGVRVEQVVDPTGCGDAYTRDS